MNSIREVAKQAGVSTATVSRAFNMPELISPQTHKRVLEAADLLDYRPLRSRLRKTVSVIEFAASDKTFIGFQFFGDTPGDQVQANAFYAPLLAGAQAEATERGLHLLVNTTDRHQIAQELPKMVREQMVTGMLLVGTADPAILSVFLERVPQIVLVDHRDPTGQHDCVNVDSFRGALDATQYLLGLGHRRIAFLRDDRPAPSFQDRLRGFVCAHFEAGCAADPRLVVSVPGQENMRSALHELLIGPHRPTALFAANDWLALEAMKVCQTLGLSIPGDLSLIGFDDIDFAAHTWPPLTTVRVPKKDLGRLAVCRLQARLQARCGASEPMPPVTIEVPTTLVVRQSCRSLNATDRK